jgi:thioredoxin reductase
MTGKSYDVVVIGGGAAGLSAALVLGRARRSVLVVDAGSPRNAPAAHMQGYLSRDGMPPADLLAAGREEMRRYGVALLADDVVSVEPGFTVLLASGAQARARRILVATGATDELPDIQGARERWGRDFLHCPYCHGWEVRDEPLGVIASVEHAHLLRQWSDDVVFFPHTTAVASDERASLDARGVRTVEGVVTRLVVEDDRITAVELSDGRRVERAAVFIRPALRPRLLPLALELDELGFVAVDRTGATSMPGVWAAGNVANPRAQVITAAGEGSAAAIAINNDLVLEDS